jgi:hypothetical protein
MQTSASACDGTRNAVRALDWTALGAWTGAAAAATVAVIAWTRPRAAPAAPSLAARPTRSQDEAFAARLRVGPGSFAFEGSF